MISQRRTWAVSVLRAVRNGLDPQSMRRRVRSRAADQDNGDKREDGFMLLESIITISLITVIMTALASFFLTAIASTGQQRAKQMATQIVDSTLDTMRSFSSTALVNGRDSNSVTSQFSAAPTAIAAWLNTMTPATDSTVSSGGATATIPTSATVQTINNIKYNVNQYLGWCWITRNSSSTDCDIASQSNGVKYLRAVVAATWVDAHCSNSLCYYTSATLISSAVDPTFNLNGSLPPLPIMTNVTQTIAIGDTVNIQLAVSNSSTAVPTFTWQTPTTKTDGTANTLPPGLAVSPTGLITGGPTVVGTYTTQFLITDGFNRSSDPTAPGTVTLTVKPQLLIADPAATSSNTGAAITPLTVTASGGAGTPYTWSDPTNSLPPGLSLSTVSNNAVISGTPTTVGVYSVTLKVADNTTTRTDTSTFTWTVTYPPLAVTTPNTQVSTVSTALSLQIAVTAGSGTYTYTGTSLPSWLSLSASGLLTGTAPSSATSSPVSVKVTDTKSNTNQTVTFTWSVVAAPTIASPGTQTGTENSTMNVAVNYTCPNTNCTIALTGAVPGIGLSTTNGNIANNVATSLVVSSASGTVYLNGTVQANAVTSGNSAAYSPGVTITDASSVVRTSTNGTWTIWTDPTIASPGTQSGTEGNAMNVAIAYTCPHTNCTIALTGTVPGIGLNAVSGGTANNVTTSLVVSSTSGTVYLNGTVQASAVTTGNSAAYSPALTITDAGAAVRTSTNGTWTMWSDPTIASAGTQTSAENSTMNVAIAYTCPHTNCTITLTGTVPGIGLNATSGGTANNVTTSLVVSATSGTVYLNGTVSATAVTSGNSTAYTPGLTITDASSVVRTAANGAWTIWVDPTIASPGTQTGTEGNTMNVAIAYTCPHTNCTITLAGGVPGIGLNTVSGGVANNSTASLIVSSASGTVYLNGTIQASAVTSGNNAPYSPAVTITDAGSVARTSTGSWTMWADPTIASPGGQVGTTNAPMNVPIAYSCPHTNCTIALTGTVPGIGLSTTNGNIANNVTTSLVVSSSSGTVYLNGTVQASAISSGNSAAYSPAVTITDAASVLRTATTGSWTIWLESSIGSPGTQTGTEGNAMNVPITYTCPHINCTIALTGTVPGIGLNATSGGTANNVTTSLVVSATSGTVYLNGTVQANAVTSGNSAPYSPAVTITDASSVVRTSTNGTWTMWADPSVASAGTQTSAENSTMNVPIAYTCPHANCTITLTGTVPGIGLNTISGGTANNVTTSLVVSSGSGTVYLNGTVSATAVASGNSAAFTPGLSITDAGSVVRTAANGAWTIWVDPTITSPGTQTGTEGNTMNVAIAYTCPHTNCTITLAGTVPGIGLNTLSGGTANNVTTSLVVSSASGTVYLNGTIQANAVPSGNSTVHSPAVSITDAGSVTRTSTGSWTIWVDPSIASPGTQTGTEGNTMNVAIAYTCPHTNCTIALTGAVPGIGLNAVSGGTANNVTTSLVVSSASGTVYLNGTVQANAVPSGNSAAYSPALTITDAGSVVRTSTNGTWTMWVDPTVVSAGTKIGTVGAAMNVAIAYTCPHTNCTIALTGTVPGIGLNAVSGGTANNVTTSLVVSSASGTVYLNGTVQASAVPSGNSAAFTPGLSITDAGSVVRTAANGAWTMYTAPTVSTLAANSFKTTTSPNVALTYTCPSASVANPCTISLSGALNGTGLSATSANTSTTATSLSVTTTSGTFYIGGTVTAAAVPSGTFKKFTPVLTIADTPLATASTTANWTAYTASYVLPTLSIPSAKSWARANLGNSASVTYGCTNKPCTITLTGSPSVPVGLGILATNTTTDQQANNSAAVSVVVNPAGTSGTVYVEGKISAAQTTGAYVLTMTNTDTNGVIVTSSFTVTVT